MAASENHLKLSNTVKRVHQDLRILSRRVGPEKAWILHTTQNSPVLKEYAEAMHSLATDYWDLNNKHNSSLCRLQWVVDRCKEYFYEGGQEIEFSKETALLTKHSIPTPPEFGWKRHHGKIYLLDVGSCYNPFKRFEEFNVVAVDLEPAEKEVIYCDFLNSSIGARNEPANGYFAVDSFDVAVFSFVLEYIPSPKQRYDIVRKATAVLRCGGILFILTPDSGHQSARSQLMRKWRVCLASLGLTRIAYEKLPHLHCMAFRRCWQPELAVRWFHDNVADGVDANQMLEIPQDKITDEDEKEVIQKENNMVDRDTVQTNFEELPYCFINDTDH